VNTANPVGAENKNEMRDKFDRGVVKEKLDKIIEQNARITQSKPEFVHLASYIDKCWSAARSAKSEIQKELYEAKLQRRGEYSPEKLKEIQAFSGSAIFMNLTAVKCRALEAWIHDALSPVGSEIWDIEPTPMPDLPPHLQTYIQELVYSKEVSNSLVMNGIDDPKELYDYLMEKTQGELEAQAKYAAERMKLKISDQLEEADWRGTLLEVLSDIATYKAGFLKGPIVRRKPALSWKQDEQDGSWSAVTENKIVVEYDRVDPFDIYPSPSSTTINDGYLIEHHRMTRQMLNELLNVPGYDEESIRLVLKEYGEGGLHDWIWTVNLNEEASDTEQSDLQSSPDNTIDALEFWGDVQGKMLLEWGMTDDLIKDPDKEYHINAWKIGNYIIKAVINQNPTGKKPYYKTSFERTPGMFWGKGVPEVMKDIQDICNATARDLINNEAISSGPQVGIDMNQLNMDQNYKEMYPWKLWYFDSETGQTRNTKAIEFFQPNSNAAELLTVYDSFAKRGDEVTGIPAYTYGGADVGGGGKTATGLSMLMSSAYKNIKFVLSNIDAQVVRPSVQELFNFNMEYSTDESIKGDLRVIAKGVMSVVAKEQTVIRRNEFLSAVAGNPVLLQVVGMRGIANLLRESARSLDMPAGDIVMSEQELEALDTQKQLIQQIQQMLIAIQEGQANSDQLVQMLMQVLGSQEQGGVMNKGTPERPSTLMPDGAKAGGVEVNTFLNKPKV